ncbi:O-antigen ligase [Fulvimarina sp. 2208YS6-2-32]|uniref:O-antigen ligase n=1 Tax=Fulvimarina uroteuthidis TaxID=3098149 RepID=A0ABU5HXZ2_9HYPH|nr:O-antigen ligase [Fulvimarina sp. 2208YS6-2-32]MDY8107643.1 O-antigen ligase [Fulvimarina sp. 2208YS6-2-32]
MQQSTYPAYELQLPLEQRLLAAGRSLFAIALMTVLVMTLEPFPMSYEAIPTLDGNPVNKYGYSALAALALVGLFMFADKRVALTLLRPAWLVLAAWLLLSSLNSIWPDLAFRSGLFTLAAMIAATGALSLPENARSFRFCLTVMALAVLGFCYYGVLLKPDIAIHQGFEIESQHSGLWRGIYSHKNIAGQVMAALGFVGLYLWRSGNRKAAVLIAALSFFFAYKTGSKTTLVLIPAVMVMVLAGRVFASRSLAALLVFCAVAGLAMMTLGSVMSETLDTLLQWVLPGTTFTGRTDLWRFTLELMETRQWVGFGIESFWPGPIVMTAEPPFELNWDPRGIVNAHNGYLDLAISIGWPGLAMGVIVLLFLPLADYVRCDGARENQRAADLFLMILTFMLLNSFLESFLFSRGNPSWMLMWISVVGLRLTARHRLAP